MLEQAGVQITWLGHDGFRLKKDRVVYLDPFQLTAAAEPADLVCVTHEHSDHLSVDDLARIVTPHTTMVTIPACRAAAVGLHPKAVRVVKPGDRVEAAPFTFEAAFHTYFAVSDVRRIAVHGLADIEYVERYGGTGRRRQDALFLKASASAAVPTMDP